MAEIGRARRLIFFGILAGVMGLVLLLLVEGMSFAALCMMEQGLATPRTLKNARRAIVEAEGSLAVQQTEDEDENVPKLQHLEVEVVHPYLGFVMSPEKMNLPHVIESWGGEHVTEFGLIGQDGLIPEPDPDRVVVGIFGGSVAFLFAQMGESALRETLERDPAFAGKEIDFVRISLGGYKQPQQLMALNYFLIQGKRFDVVVNIDGFNELCLPYVENQKLEVSPIFPRSWYWRVTDVPDLRTRRAIGEAVYLERKRKKIARSFSKRPMLYSFTWNLVWRLRDNGLAAELAAAQTRVQESQQDKEGRFVARGPYEPWENDDVLFDELVDTWWRSSLQMHHLCEANGIRYHHFLQPNQYLPGSKPMGADEKKVAFVEQSPYARLIPAMYPMALEAGASLAQQGVRFHDLTGVFRDVSEALYIDTCCHFNTRGNAIMAEVVAQAILDDPGLAEAIAR